MVRLLRNIYRPPGLPSRVDDVFDRLLPNVLRLLSRMRFKCLILTVLLLLLVLTAARCFPSEKPVVYFGVNLRYDPIVMYERYQPMMDYLTKNTPYKFELKISRGYREGVRQLAEGKTQIASVGDGGLMAAMLNHGALPIVKPLNEDGKPLYRSYIVVASRSPIKSPRQLKGKRIALGYRHSLTGNLVARHMLWSYGLSADNLAALDNLHMHSSVAKAVIRGEYDAGVLKDVAARGYLKRGLRIIATSEEFPSIPLIAGRSTSPAVVRAFVAALVKLDPLSPADRKILAEWDEEYRHGFVPARSSDYRETERVYLSKPYGCGSSCHR